MKTILKISLLLCLCIRVHAQFIGYTAPQTLNMTNTQLFGTATINHSGTSNIFTDIGNTVHFVSYQCTNVNQLSAFVEASPTGTAGTYTRISSISYNVASGGLTAYYYQRFVRINITRLTTASGSCTFAYTGTSVTNALLQGIFSTTGANLLAWENATANTSYNFPFQPVNARLGGTLWFQYLSPSGQCASLTISVTGYPAGINATFPSPPTTTAINVLPLETVTASGTVAPAQVYTAQAFSIPDMQATDALVTVQPGSGSGCGVSGALFTMWYSTAPVWGGAVQGPIPSGQADQSTYGPVKIGCVYNSTPPAVASGSLVNFGCGPDGSIIIVPSAASSCPLHAFVNLSGSGDTQVIAATGGKAVVVCVVAFSSTATEDVKLTYGTGSNCGTGNTDLSSLWKTVQSGVLQLPSNVTGWTTTASQAVCVNQSAAQANGVDMFYRLQ